MKVAYVCVIGRCMWDCTGMRQLDQKGRECAVVARKTGTRRRTIIGVEFLEGELERLRLV